MKKYLYLLFVALFATMSLALVSCGDDDDDEPNAGGSISINGKNFPISRAFTMEGELRYGTASFCLSVLDGDIVEYYVFEYDTDVVPQANTVVSSKNLVMTALVSYDEIGLDEFEYVSGKATITSVNPSKNQIVVKYDNLKMSDGDYSFTFNGTATSSFDFATHPLP